MLDKVLRRTSRARADSTWVACGFPSLDLTGRLSFQSAYSIHANKPPKNGGCLGERVLFQLVNSYLKEPLETPRSLRNVPSRHLTSCQPYEEPAPAPQEPWAQNANHGNVFVVCTKLLLSLSLTMYIYIYYIHIYMHMCFSGFSKTSNTTLRRIWRLPLRHVGNTGNPVDTLSSCGQGYPAMGVGKSCEFEPRVPDFLDFSRFHEPAPDSWVNNGLLKITQPFPFGKLDQRAKSFTREN